MSEFNTLKDLSAEEWKNRKHFVELWVRVEELKQEAIKRWKHFKEKYMKEKDEKQRIHYWGRMEEIKEFNNLTEEDLK